MYRLTGVTKRYTRGKETVEALRGVDLTIEDGDQLVIQGPTGGGKSTLLQMIGGLDRPTEGSVELDGVDLAKISEAKLTRLRAEKIGIIFQSFNLIPTLTAQENVETALVPLGVKPAERRERAAEALRSVGLGERLGHAPSEMSGGQQQRVAIARALITNPSLILADEPTGNLDSRTSLEIIALFQQLNLDRGMTVVYVTHEPDIAQHAGRILQMRDGSIVSDVRNEDRLWAPDELRKLGPGLADLPAQGQVPPAPATRPPAKPRLAPTG